MAALEASLQGLQSEHDLLRLQQQKVKARLSCLEKSAAETCSVCLHVLSPEQAAVVEEEKERSLLELQRKVASLERRLEGNLSQDEHLQELLQEVNHSFRASPQHYLRVYSFN